MTHPFPDLEIYIRTPDIAQLAACLETALSLSHWKQDGSVLRARIRNESSQADSHSKHNTALVYISTYLVSCSVPDEFISLLYDLSPSLLLLWVKVVRRLKLV